MVATPVLFSEIASTANKKIAVATLNAEKTLNALTLDMVDLLTERLLQWHTDDSISCVFIQGAGPKAFCAGGDIQQLYQSAVDQPGGPCDYAEAFFTREYRLDYLLHCYTKPIICWGHGIVMGGGLGILAGCSHRVVTEKTRMAMPEITIGLYPDVGGSWFLNRMPGRVGLFLALTAAQMNASDCLYTGIADRFIENARKDDVLAGLVSIDWRGNNQKPGEQVTQLLRAFEQSSVSSKPADNVAGHYALIQQLTDQNSFFDVVDAIIGYDSEDAWLSAASASLQHGSALSACNIFQALEKTKSMSLAEVFRFELMLSTNIVRHPEFAEGVRALLIEKDKSPKWLYPSVRDVPDNLLQQMITPPWPTNPLKTL